MPEKFISTKAAIKQGLTVNQLLKARGVDDKKGVIKEAAKEHGYDLNKTIDAFMKETIVKEPSLSALYQKPHMADMEHAFGLVKGPEVATIAVMAVGIAVVAIAFAAITDKIASRVNLLTQIYSRQPDVNAISQEVNKIIQY